MKPLNIFVLTRVAGDRNLFNILEQHLSTRRTRLELQEHEIQSLAKFVRRLTNCDDNHSIFDNYYYSFKIPQIGKEFDLLRIGKSRIINIELKSQKISLKKIEHQLKRNRFYLQHLNKQISLFTIVTDTLKVYQLTKNDDLMEVSLNVLLEELRKQTDFFKENINDLFKPSQFLVSPLNTPKAFLEGRYFLTQHQMEIKSKFFDLLKSNTETLFIALTGDAGTGKTLLLYDLARACSFSSNVCMIHCGMLSEGHRKINELVECMDVIAAKELKEGFSFDHYDYLFVDECQRFYEDQFNLLIEIACQLRIPTILSYDPVQTLSRKEERTNIPFHIDKLPNLAKFGLTTKVRTNQELAAFILKVLNKNHLRSYPEYPNVTILFANDTHEGEILLEMFLEREYTFVEYTKSRFNPGPFDSFYGDYNTHDVIGQEFDNVVMIMDKTFHYDKKGFLRASLHPNDNYLYRQLLYQGMTRAREKLALIVVGSHSLFEQLLAITYENK